MAFGILPILHVARLRRSVIATAAVSLASSFTAVTFVSRCPIPLLKRRWARLAVLDSAAEARSGSHGGAQRPIRRVASAPAETIAGGGRPLGSIPLRYVADPRSTFSRLYRSLPSECRSRTPLFRNCYPWCTNRGNSTVRVNSWQRGRRFDAQGCIFMATALGAAQRACDASPAAGCALGDGAKAGAGSGMQHSCERKYP